MLIPVKQLQEIWKVSPNRVIHIGAHCAEELEAYLLAGWTKVTWIEANPDLIESLRQRVEVHNHKVICATLWHTSGVSMNFNIASNGQSSSVLTMDLHSYLYPEIKTVRQIQVLTSRLDELVLPGEMANFCNLDIQGSELDALKGFGRLLDHVDTIYTEINRASLYSNCAQVKDLDSFLHSNGFNRVATRWVLGYHWGDALYIRDNPTLQQRLVWFCLSLIYYFKQVPHWIWKRMYDTVQTRSRRHGDRL